VKLLNWGSHCVMEATGYYHYQLAYHLLESGIKVSVENPLAVERFIQMKLSKIKTDKSDSKLICEYANRVDLKLWQGSSKVEIECLQITRAHSVYTKQSTMLKNKLHGEAVLGNPSKVVVTSLKRSLRQLQKEIKDLEDIVVGFGKTGSSRFVNAIKNYI
jgi:transposase